MSSPLRILHLEDDANDAELVHALLEGDGIVCQVTRVETRHEFLASLEAGGFDLILADYSLPSFDGLSALQLAVEMRPEVPFIFVSGALGEEVAIEALKIGATDYVLKERLSRTSAAVSRALREARFRAERERAEQERRAHLWVLESMDRINRAMHGTQDLEHMLSEVLRAALEIFACDRAWLVYPCDPHAPRWRAVMEQTRPEYPRAFAPGTELPIDADVAALFSAGLAAPGAVLSGPGLSPAIPPQPAGQLAIRSQIAMVIEAKADRPYLLGLHQCSRTREWTAPERRLFQEIGRRFGDALASLSMFRSLRDSERKLGAAQKIAHVGWWERDYVSGRVSLSDEACRIFGVQPLDLPYWQERWASLIHPEDREKTVAASEIALAGGPRYDVEYRVVRPEGTVRVVHSQGDVIRDESGRPLRQFGAMQDITELRRAEDELRASEARFRTFVDHAKDAFFLLDEQVRVVDVNRQACESMGWSREEFIGMHPREFDVELDDPSIGQLAERTRAGEIITFETRHRRKDGTVFPVEIRSGTFTQGGKLFYLALARDISERKLAEETLRAKDSALETARTELAHMSRLTTLGELTISIAHEVGQPLGAMAASAGAGVRWLAADPPAIAEAQAALANIVADAKRAREVIARVRALTKRQAPRKEQLDINHKIEEVLALTEHELRSHDIVLRTELDRTLPRVAGDRVHLQQVLLNLIVNAVEAMSAVHDRSRELTIVSRQDGSDAVLVEVRDSGGGLDAQRAEQVFEAFYTTKAEGIGIGLSISRSIIEAHGGRLWATANAPHGAIFRFSLPVTKDAVA
jgi:PAS domain S-box-containing protein